MKLLNLHKYKPGDRLQNKGVTSRIQTIVRFHMYLDGGKKVYCTRHCGAEYLLDEDYLDTEYRRIGNEVA